MISFKNDYSEGAHPRILEYLGKTNLEQTDGYGTDSYCKNAAALIKKQLRTDCEVVFLSGGTQANLAIISHALRQHQAVISVDSGHIFTNEAGAIEATGHKVMTVPGVDGKLTVEGIEGALATVTNVPHVVQPKLVYLSHPTEFGTLYSKKELQGISALCKAKDMYLYIDGARMGCALAAQKSQLTLADIAELTDAFTIGGTKNGAMFGEAMVISSPQLAKDFLFTVKQKGGMLAKGRMMGLQFEALFADELYVELGEHANKMAAILKEGLTAAGCRFLFDSVTNQQFAYLPDAVAETLAKTYGMIVWVKPKDGYTVVRLVTSWATKEADVRQFVQDCGALMANR